MSATELQENFLGDIKMSNASQFEEGVNMFSIWFSCIYFIDEIITKEAFLETCKPPPLIFVTKFKREIPKNNQEPGFYCPFY